MKLFYYQDPEGNFGDDLNTWLWPRLVPGLLDDDDNTLFVGIGSILDRRIPEEPRKVVFGTGVGYGLLPVLDDRWQIYCVRGPLTAQALGLPAHSSVTDPAMLVRSVPALRTAWPAALSTTKRVSFIPHFRSPARASALGADLEKVCASLGINYIDPRWDIERVLAGIEASRMVLAEAMHGAIVADALRIPWVPVQLFDQILNLKWRDWCGSLGMQYRPLRHAGSEADAAASLHLFLAGAAAGTTPFLSEEGVLRMRIEQLLMRLEELKEGRPGTRVTGSSQFTPNPSVLKEVSWLHDMQCALEEVAAAVPPGAKLVLVDEQRWGGGQSLRGRQTLPFLEHDGRYWGLPPDSDTAIRELERLVELGAEYLVFMWPSFWWLSYYGELHSYLRRYATLASSNRVVVFALSSTA